MLEKAGHSDYQICSVLYFVPQLYTIISTHTYEQFFVSAGLGTV